MPAYSTFPTILDEEKQISITKLKEFGLMEPDSFKSGRLSWSSRGEEIGSINISVDLRESPHCFLWYTYNKEEQVRYKVNLDSVESNLGRGRIWYFVCPHTGKRCRKLYGVGKYFLHRDAFPDAMYECQTYSENQRNMNKVFDAVFGIDEYDDWLYQKHFKTHYNGKPTKKYLKVLEKKNMAKKMRKKLMDYFD